MSTGHIWSHIVPISSSPRLLCSILSPSFTWSLGRQHVALAFESGPVASCKELVLPVSKLHSPKSAFWSQSQLPCSSSMVRRGFFQGTASRKQRRGARCPGRYPFYHARPHFWRRQTLRVGSPQGNHQSRKILGVQVGFCQSFASCQCFWDLNRLEEASTETIT